MHHLSPSLREMLQDQIGRVAREQSGGDANSYLAHAAFNVLRTLQGDLDRMLPTLRSGPNRLQELKQELLRSFADQYLERNFCDVLQIFTDLVARESRPGIERRVQDFPLQVRESLRYHLRRKLRAANDLEAVDPVIYLHRMGTIIGSMLRRYYLQVFDEAMDGGIVRVSELPWSWEEFSDRWSEIQEQIHRGRAPLELSSTYMERMRMVEGLLRQTLSEWGELHPLYEGFAETFFSGLESEEATGVLWDRMLEVSRNLERDRRLRRHDQFPEAGQMGWISEGEGEGQTFLDPTSSFFAAMPDAIRDLVFGDLEFLGHQFAATPEYALAHRLVEVVAADQGRAESQEILERGHTAHEMHRAAQWIRSKMVELYHRNRIFYDRLLEYYLDGLSEASLLPLIGEMQQLPRVLTGSLTWNPARDLGAETPRAELQTRGAAIGFVLRLAMMEMLQFGESRGLFDLEGQGLDRQSLQNYLETTGRSAGPGDFTEAHLQSIGDLDRFILRVHYQWGNYHPLVQGFSENFPEHDILGPHSRQLRALRQEVEEYLRSREVPH